MDESWYEYEDLRLAAWPWPDIYPCPITACWIHTMDIEHTGFHCGQSACCNPAHWNDAQTFPFPLDGPWSSLGPLRASS